MAEFVDHQLGGVGVDGLVCRDHHAHFHQDLDDVGRAFGHAVGQFRDHDGFGQLDIADLLFGALVAAHGFLPGFFLLALHRGKAALAAAFTIQCLAQRQLAGAAAVLAALATAVAVVRPAAGVAVAVGLARASGADALGFGADGCGLGSGTVGGGRRARRCLGLGKLGLFLFTQLGLAGTALILFGFQPQGFFTLTLFTLFGLGFQPAAFALF